jgi:hypothetical protein
MNNLERTTNVRPQFTRTIGERAWSRRVFE